MNLQFLEGIVKVSHEQLADVSGAVDLAGLQGCTRAAAGPVQLPLLPPRETGPWTAKGCCCRTAMACMLATLSRSGLC